MVSVRQAIQDVTGIQGPMLFVCEGQGNAGRFVLLNQNRLAEIDEQLGRQIQPPDLNHEQQEYLRLKAENERLIRTNNQLQARLAAIRQYLG